MRDQREMLITERKCGRRAATSVCLGAGAEAGQGRGRGGDGAGSKGGRREESDKDKARNVRQRKTIRRMADTEIASREKYMNEGWGRIIHL